MINVICTGRQVLEIETEGMKEGRREIVFSMDHIKANGAKSKQNQRKKSALTGLCQGIFVHILSFEEDCLPSASIFLIQHLEYDMRLSIKFRKYHVVQLLWNGDLKRYFQKKAMSSDVFIFRHLKNLDQT